MYAFAMASVSLLISPVADPSYLILLKQPGLANRVKVSHYDQRQIEVSAFFNQEPTERTTFEGRRMIYTDEVLKRTVEGQPKKLRRTYEEAIQFTDGIKKNTVEAQMAILVEKKGDKFEFAYEDGKTLPGVSQGLLHHDFNVSSLNAIRELLTPTRPVKVQEKWKVETAQAAVRLGVTDMTVDSARSHAEGKLTKYYRKDGRGWGVMEFEIVLTVTKLNAGRTEVKLRPGSQLQATLIVEACIDGTNAGYVSETTTKGSLDGEVPGLKMSMKMAGKSGSRSEELVK